MKLTRLLFALFSTPCLAGALTIPPGLDRAGQAGWEQYRKAAAHRAFAIAPGGVWAWQEGLPSAAAAEQTTLSLCGQQTRNPCQLFDLDGTPRMSAENWAASLSSRYTTNSANATEGTGIGQRFPDLMLADKATPSLSSLRGKVVVLHFWASWCPPCVTEIPDFAGMVRKMGKNPNLHILAIPAFEEAAATRDWLDASNIALKITASVSAGPQRVKLRAGGSGATEAPLRALVPNLPTTYILDRNGIVLFRHPGPVPDWESMLPILRHAAQSP